MSLQWNLSCKESRDDVRLYLEFLFGQAASRAMIAGMSIERERITRKADMYLSKHRLSWQRGAAKVFGNIETELQLFVSRQRKQPTNKGRNAYRDVGGGASVGSDHAQNTIRRVLHRWLVDST